jgi:hypothetical protein
MSIDLSELINDPDFQESFTIRRQATTTVNGETRTTSADIAVMGVVHPASPADVRALPEGDRLKNVYTFWSKNPIMATLGAPDVLVKGDGTLFRLAKLEARTRYWKAFAGEYIP